MKVILTKRNAITAKSGVKYGNYSGVAENGKAITLWLTEEQEKMFGVSEENCVPVEDVASFVRSSGPVDVYFDDTGRVESVAV